MIGVMNAKLVPVIESSPLPNPRNDITCKQRARAAGDQRHVDEISAVGEGQVQRARNDRRRGDRAHEHRQQMLEGDEHRLRPRHRVVEPVDHGGCAAPAGSGSGSIMVMGRAAPGVASGRRTG